MRIGIDIRPLQGETQFRGIGKSLEYLMTSLSSMRLSHSFVFYLDGGLPTPNVITLFPDAKLISIDTARLGRMRFFRSFLPSYKPAHPAKKDVDVFLLYDASLGIPTTVPTVTIFHDAIPLLFHGKEPKEHVVGMRKYKNALATWLYWHKYLRVLKQYKRSARIIAISTASKNDFIKYVGGVSESNIHVIPHGVAGFDVTGKVTKKIVNLTRSPYILYVGGIDYRKNIVGLVKTFYKLKQNHPNIKLVTVGKEFGLTDQLNDLGWFQAVKVQPQYAKDIIMPGFISNAELAYLYQKAAAFVFPSRYEGFGMMLLEAFQAGCPVVAYDNSCIPEVAGDAALIVRDGKSLVPATEKLLTDNRLRTRLIKKGKMRAQSFTWSRTAKDILYLLEQTATR